MEARANIRELFDHGRITPCDCNGGFLDEEVKAVKLDRGRRLRHCDGDRDIAVERALQNRRACAWQ